MSRKIDEIKDILATTRHLTLREWQKRPHVLQRTHADLLHLLHRLMEMEESLHLVRKLTSKPFFDSIARPLQQRLNAALKDFDAAGGSGSGTVTLPTGDPDNTPNVPDFEQVKATWRERLPSMDDSIPVWNDIITWRNRLFRVMSSAIREIRREQAKRKSPLDPKLSAEIRLRESKTRLIDTVCRQFMGER
ncbi:MAG: hypothetical protein MHM6MM_009351, partial [Cercozoa sp. M6MM]